MVFVTSESFLTKKIFVAYLTSGGKINSGKGDETARYLYQKARWEHQDNDIRNVFLKKYGLLSLCRDRSEDDLDSEHNIDTIDI